MNTKRTNKCNKCFVILFYFSVCSEGKNEDLLHEVILIVGYFTVLNNDNQVGSENLSEKFSTTNRKIENASVHERPGWEYAISQLCAY